MPLVGFEPMIPASARSQTYALDRAAAGISLIMKHKYRAATYFAKDHFHDLNIEMKTDETMAILSS
jgi:hypothetical protein